MRLSIRSCAIPMQRRVQAGLQQSVPGPGPAIGLAAGPVRALQVWPSGPSMAGAGRGLGQPEAASSTDWSAEHHRDAGLPVSRVRARSPPACEMLPEGALAVASAE